MYFSSNNQKEKRGRGEEEKKNLPKSVPGNTSHSIPCTKSVTWNSKPQNCLHCCWLLCLSPAASLPCHRLLWPTLLSIAREFIPLAEMSQSLRYRRCVNWWISVSVALFQHSLPSTSWSHHPLSSPSIYEPGQVLSLPLPCPGCKSLATPISMWVLHLCSLTCDNVMFAHLLLYKE